MLQAARQVLVIESWHPTCQAHQRHQQCVCPSIHSPHGALPVGRRRYTSRQSRLQARRKESRFFRDHLRHLRLCPTSGVRQCLTRLPLRPTQVHSPRSCASRSVFLQANRCVVSTQCRQLPNQARRRPKTRVVRCFRHHHFPHSTSGGA